MEQAINDLNQIMFELDHMGVPQNFTAEESVVGFLLAHPERTGSLLPRLAPVDFERGFFRGIWMLAEALHKMGEPVTPHNLYNLVGRLKLGARFDEVTGGMDYIMELLQNAPHEASIQYYLDVVAHTAYRRKVVRMLDGIQELASKPNGDNRDLNAKSAAVMQYILRQGAPQEAPKQPPRLAFTAAEFTASAGSSPEWLVQDLILKGGLNLLAGEVGSGKTFLALDLAIAAASGGIPWRPSYLPLLPLGEGWDEGKQGTAICGLQVEPHPAKTNVLYLCLDTSRQTLQRRLAALCLGRRIDPPAGLHFDLSPLDLSLPKSLDTLRSLVRDKDAGLVILDALARYLPGIDENTVASISPVLTGLRSLVTSDGITILLLHHLNKGSGYASNAPSALRIRGSSDILAAVDTALICTGGAGGASAYPNRRLIPVKNREQPESPPLTFEIQVVEDGGLRLAFLDNPSKVAPPSMTTIERLCALLQGHPGQSLTRQDLVNRLGEDGSTISCRTFDRSFTKMRSIPGIQVRRKGNFLSYTWTEPP